MINYTIVGRVYLVVLVFAILIISAVFTTRNIKKYIPENVKIGGVRTNFINNVKLKDIKVIDTTSPYPSTIKDISLEFNLFQIIKSRDIVSSIKEINIADAKIFITRKRDGKWNFEYLIKKGDEKRKLTFQGKINVKKCDIVFVDEYPAKEYILHNFKNVNFVVDFSFLPLVLFKAKNKGVIYICGKYNIENEDFDMYLNAKSQKLILWKNYLPKHNLIDIKDGIFDIDTHIIRNDGNLYFSGDANLQNGEVSIRHFKKSCSNISAKLQFTNKDILITSLKFNFGQGNVDGSGIVSLFGKQKIYFVCNVKNILTSDFGKYSAGILSLLNSRLIVHGDLTSPHVEGDVLLDKIVLHDFNIKNVQSKIRYHNNNLLLSNFCGSVFGEEIKGDGFLKITQNAGIFNIKTTGLNFDNFVNLFKGERKVKEITFPKIYLTISSEKVIYNSDINFKQGYIVAEYANGEGRIIASGFFNEDEKIFLDGNVWSDDMKISVNMHNLKISKLDKYLKGDYKADGLLFGEGNISGDFAYPRMDYEFVIISPEVNFVKNYNAIGFDEIKGSITLSDGLLEINNLSFEKNKTSLVAEGKVELSEEKNINIKIETPYFDVEDITKEDIREMDISFWGSAVLEGTLDDVSSYGTLFVNKANIFGETISGGKINFAKIKDIVEIQPSYVNFGDSLFHISGPLNIKDKTLDISIGGKDIRAKDIYFLSKQYSKVDGILTCWGRVSGTYDMLQFDLYLEGKDIELGDGKIETISLSVNGDKNFISTTQKIVMSEGEIILNGNLQRDEELFFLSVISNFKDIDIENIFSIFKFIPPTDIKGKISGGVNLVSDVLSEDKIKFEDVKGKIEIFSENFNVSKNVIDKINIHSNLEGNRVYIRTMEIIKGDSIVVADGNISFGGESDLFVEGYLIDPELFKEILPPLNVVSGRVNFTTKIKGNIRNPEIVMNIEGVNIAVFGYRMDIARSSFSIEEDIIRISDFLLEKNNQRVYGEGFLPFSLKDRKIPSEKNMSIKIITQGVNLGMLKDFVDEINFAYGDVLCHLMLQGTKERPVLSGEILVLKGEIDFFTLEDTIKDIQIKVYFNGDEVIINKVSGKIKNGVFDISGNLHIKDFNIDKWDINLSSDGIFLSLPPTFQGNVKLSLRYLKDENIPTLYGDITIKNSKYVLSFPTKDEGLLNAPPLSDTLYNLSIKVEDDVWIRNNNLRMEVKGNLHFRGKVTEPIISGKLTSKKGNVSYLDTIFKIEEANIYFPKLYTLEPAIQATASTYLKFSDESGTYNIPVVLKLDGDVSQMKMDIEYDDKEYFLKTGGKQLSKKDVISRLAHKHTIDEVLKGDITDVIQRSARGVFEKSLHFEIFDPLERTMGKVLGLTDFGVEYDAQRDYKLRLGKLIERNFYVSYNRSFAKDGMEKFRLEHHFLRGSFLFYEIEKLKNISLYRTGLLLKYQI